MKSGACLPGQRLGVSARLVVGIGDGELRAQFMESLGAAPGNRMLIGNAGHQRFLALQNGTQIFQNDAAPVCSLLDGDG